MRLEWEQDGQYYQTIENFWKDDKNRQASTWIEHREIQHGHAGNQPGTRQISDDLRRIAEKISDLPSS